MLWLCCNFLENKNYPKYDMRNLKNKSYKTIFALQIRVKGMQPKISTTNLIINEPKNNQSKNYQQPK